MSPANEVSTLADSYSHGIIVEIRLPGKPVVLVDCVIDICLDPHSCAYLLVIAVCLLYFLFHRKRLKLGQTADYCLPLALPTLRAVLLDAGVLILVEEYLCLHELANIGGGRAHTLQGLQDLLHAGSVDAAEGGEPLHIFLEVDQRTRRFPFL